MSKVRMGAKYPRFAKIATEPTASLPTYATPIVTIGELIAANLTISYADGELYSDDALNIKVSEFSNGAVAMENDGLEPDVYAALFGAETDEDGMVTHSAADSAPNGGLGYYTRMKDKTGATFYARITVLELYPEAPEAPENLRQTARTAQSISLAWDASTDATGYKLYRDGTLLATTTALAYTDSDLLPSQTVSYAVLAYNDHGDGDLCTAVEMQTETAYYIVRPVISDPALSPTTVAINMTVTLSVSVTDELIILQPEIRYSGEFFAGEG